MSYRVNVPKIDSSPTFHKSHKRDNILVFKFCLWTKEEHIWLKLTP